MSNHTVYDGLHTKNQIIVLVLVTALIMLMMVALTGYAVRNKSVYGSSPLAQTTIQQVHFTSQKSPQITTPPQEMPPATIRNAMLSIFNEGSNTTGNYVRRDVTLTTSPEQGWVVSRSDLPDFATYIADQAGFNISMRDQLLFELGATASSTQHDIFVVKLIPQEAVEINMSELGNMKPPSKYIFVAESLVGQNSLMAPAISRIVPGDTIVVGVVQ